MNIFEEFPGIANIPSKYLTNDNYKFLNEPSDIFSVYPGFVNIPERYLIDGYNRTETIINTQQTDEITAEIKPMNYMSEFTRIANIAKKMLGFTKF